MERSSRRIPRRVIGLLATAVLALAAFGVGMAHADTVGNTYTGCLGLGGVGLITRVAIGTSPSSSCGNATKISWNQTGPAGTNGAPGAPGQTGPQGPMGQGLVWKGHYDQAVAYNINDAVENGGSAYVAIAPVPASCVPSPTREQPCPKIGNGPPNSTFWSLLASAGAPGTPGLAGQDGHDGKSAYQIWLDQGNSGTEQDFLNELKGPQGPPGTSGTGIANIDDLEGLPCGTTNGVFHVTYGGDGSVTFSCLLPTVGLQINMTGLFTGQLSYATGTVTGTVDGVSTISCQLSSGASHTCNYNVPRGSTVILTPSSTSTITAPACDAGSTANACVLNMTGTTSVEYTFG